MPDLRSPITDHRPPTSTGDKGPSATDQVWAYYLEVCNRVRPRKRPRLTTEVRKLVVKALKDWPIDDLKLAISGLFLSPHHLGQNDTRTEWLDIKYALRKPEMFINLVEAEVSVTYVRPTQSLPEGERASEKDLEALLSFDSEIFS